MAPTESFILPLTNPLRISLPGFYLPHVWIITELQELAASTERDDVVFEFEYSDITVRVDRNTNPEELSERLDGMISARSVLDFVCGP